MSSSFIEIKRQSGYWADRVRAYKIVIDKKSVARIDEGENQTIEVTPGPHTVHLRIDFCCSQMLKVDVREAETISLLCWPNAKLYTWPFFLSLGRTHYIALRLEQRGPPPAETRVGG